MASLQSDPSGNYHVKFRLGGRQYRRSLRTKLRRKLPPGDPSNKVSPVSSDHLHVPLDRLYAAFANVGDFLVGMSGQL